MSMETLNLLIGLVGLVLGFVAAYAQIKGFFSRVLHIGGSAVLGKIERDKKRARFFLSQPTAFGAYVTRSVIWIFGLVAIRLNFNLIPSDSLLHWVTPVLAFVVPVLIGFVIGSLLTVCSNILDVAHAEAKSGSEG